MIKLFRYRSALKSAIPIVWFQFFDTTPPVAATDEVIEELDQGEYLTDSDLLALKRRYFEAARAEIHTPVVCTSAPLEDRGTVKLKYSDFEQFEREQEK